MKLARTLDQLERQTSSFVQRAKAGRPRRRSAIELFELADRLTEAGLSPTAVAQIMIATEGVIRAGTTGKNLDLAWASHRVAVSNAKERTD